MKGGSQKPWKFKKHWSKFCIQTLIFSSFKTKVPETSGHSKYPNLPRVPGLFQPLLSSPYNSLSKCMLRGVCLQDNLIFDNFFSEKGFFFTKMKRENEVYLCFLKSISTACVSNLNAIPVFLSVYQWITLKIAIWTTYFFLKIYKC